MYWNVSAFKIDFNDLSANFMICFFKKRIEMLLLMFSFFFCWKIDFNVESLHKNQWHNLTQGLTLKMYTILSGLEFHKPRIWKHIIQKATILPWGKMPTEISCILTKHFNCPYSNTEGALYPGKNASVCLCVSTCLEIISIKSP